MSEIQEIEATQDRFIGSKIAVLIAVFEWTSHSSEHARCPLQCQALSCSLSLVLPRLQPDYVTIQNGGTYKNRLKLNQSALAISKQMCFSADNFFKKGRFTH